MTAPNDKSLSRGFSADMSSNAILHRLKIVDELYQLGKLLARARYVGKVEDLQNKEPGSPGLAGISPGIDAGDDEQ